MVEKFFASHNKTNSFDDLSDIKLSKKIDILFIDSKIEDRDKFCLSYQTNNSIKDFLKFEDFASFSAKILLLRIVSHGLNVRDFIDQNLANNNQIFKNSLIIDIEDCQYALSTLEYVFKNSENLSQIIANLMASGINFSVNFIDENGNIIKYIYKNSFNSDRYNLELVEKNIKQSLILFKQFIEQNLPNYHNEINEINSLLLTNFISNNYYIYLKNFFTSYDFCYQSQINNPDNFSLLLNEIINYYKKIESSNFIILESFIENCLIPSNIEKSNPNDLVLCVKKIIILSKILDKISVIMQMSLIASFQNSLNQVKSVNLTSFLIINLYENIIFNESKIFLLNNVKKNNFLANRGIELSNIFSGYKIDYKSLFDEQSDYSFSELTATTYFNILDKDIFLNIVCSYEKTFNPLKLIFKKKFINFIIVHSSNYTLKNMTKYIDDNFDDIEKNRIRDGVSRAIFSKKFIDNNFERIRLIYRLIPIEVQQVLPSELAPSKNKSKLFD